MITYAETQIPGWAWRFRPGVLPDGLVGFHVDFVALEDGTLATYVGDVPSLPRIEVGGVIEVEPYEPALPFWTSPVKRVWRVPCLPT